MATTSYVSNAAKYFALSKAIASDTIKAAFYSDAKDASFAAYSATNEVTDTGAGTPIPVGGVTLATVAYSASSAPYDATATVTWADKAITPTQQVQFRSVVIYNDSQTPKYTLCVIDFGATQTWNASTQYTLDFPASGTSNGLIKIA